VEAVLSIEIMENRNEMIVVLKPLVKELLEQSEYTEQIILQSRFVIAKFN
jgi:hypothetical protein